MKIHILKTKIAAGLLTGLLTLATTAWADWPDPNTIDKWVQQPDLVTGVNVLATQPKILADDFQCRLTGPITDIHIWGSWLWDNWDPTVEFRLSIHSNIPVGPGGYSIPGQQLWAITNAPAASRLWATTPGEPFYDPNVGTFIGTDTQIWQYNFKIPETLAFRQEEGNIYWLDVMAFTIADTLFGWKTTDEPWMDRAVWGDMPIGGTADWHPLQWDMAFVITTIPEPGTLALLGLGSGLLVMLWQLRSDRS